MSAPKCYDRFNRPVSNRKVKCDPKEGLTQQEFKKECDINSIMARVLRTGQFPPNARVGRYGDFSEVDDFQSAQELILNAKTQFSGLPAKVRERFKNDPARFLEWIHSKDVDMEEANSLGLLSDEAKKRYVKPKSVDEPPPKVP